jgi:hypothetical protein
MKRFLALVGTGWLVAGLGALPAQAKLPEPYHVLYGSARVDGVPLAKGTVKLYQPGSTVPMATYTAGSLPDAAGKYVLRVPIDSLLPRVEGTAVPGDTVEIYVNGLWADRATVGEKGTIQEVNVDAITVHRLVFVQGPAGTPSPVESGGSAAVAVAVRDTVGHALTYAWAALCPGLPDAGAFLDASKAATQWTAPRNATGNPQACTLSVAVTDSRGLTETRSYSHAVRPAPDTVVIASGPSGTPNPVASVGTATLSAAAEDSLGHTLTYAWSAACPDLAGVGSFQNVSGATSWTAPANHTGARKECTITVSARDAFGRVASAFYQQGVNADPHSILITRGAGGTPNPVRQSGVVALGVTAGDTKGHPLVYAWSASCPGYPSSGSFSNAASRAPLWTAPRRSSQLPGDCLIEVAVSDGLGARVKSSYRQGVSNGIPMAVGKATPETVACPGEIVFDGSSSYHPDPTRRIVSWEWDFSYDGKRFNPQRSGQTIAYTYGEVGPHTVALRVKDDRALPEFDVATLLVGVDGTAPVANAGGPYGLAYGAPLALDGSGSFDADAGCGDRIEEYAWDLNGDGLYEEARGRTVKLGWDDVQQGMCGGICTVGASYPVGLRVTDRLGYRAEASGSVLVNELDEPIRLTSPNGGEMIGTGTNAQITFVSRPEVEAVELSLARGSGDWRVILPAQAREERPGSETSPETDGYRLWKVPLGFVGTERHYRMKIVGYEAGSASAADVSDGDFGMGPLNLTAPVAGEELAGGRTTTIRWDRFATVRTPAWVRIRYSLDGGQAWKLARTAALKGASIAWRVPVVREAQHDCRLMAELLDQAGRVVGRDQSAGAFTILGPVDVTGPEEGDFVLGGTSRQVRWKTLSSAPVTRVKLLLTTDGGATWSTAALLKGNPGVYSWDAPAVTEKQEQCAFAVVLYYADGRVIARDAGKGFFTLLPRR